MKHDSFQSVPTEAIDAEELGGKHHCACGALLARWVEGGLELKCRRCKRIVTVRLPEPPPDSKATS